MCGEGACVQDGQPLKQAVHICNNFETVLDFAQSALKLVVLDSHKTYHI